MKYAILDDHIVPEEEVKIQLMDRGYHFGDGIYEVVRLYNGSFFAMDAHLERLFSSAAKLDMDIPFTQEKLVNLSTELVKKEALHDGAIYMQLTRGATPRNHLYQRGEKPILTGFTLPAKPPVEDQKQGISAYVTDDIRWLRCDIKSINLLGNVMAKREASDHECGEAIMHRDGIVTEGSSSNLFLVNDRTLYTHPANHLILNGITRQQVIELAKKLDLQVVEEPFPKEVLAQADEAFVTSTSIEVTPITTFKGQVEASLSIGTVTRELQEAFASLIPK
ncbi:D-amino-acid transaminase [Shouchella shacheensis]|uniref:D-amino-acid transaminase n=1 Tax=Shouchella shacheensis TaxID=1649580 RepID=UPI0007402127|nr:D-amino-acid transaminase [Shouchella shacheensis]